MFKNLMLGIGLICLGLSCNQSQQKKSVSIHEIDFARDSTKIIISKENYHNKLQGFWLGQCIANWTGLITEMDKIGNIGDIKTGDFYTREDWGQLDQPSIWGEGIPSDLSKPLILFLGIVQKYGELMTIQT